MKADRAQIAKLEAETKALRLETTELRTKVCPLEPCCGCFPCAHPSLKSHQHMLCDPVNHSDGVEQFSRDATAS